MKQYKIYANPQGSYEAVKQGWSWPAFFFSLFWAMVKNMWALGVGVLIGFIVLVLFIGNFVAGQDGQDLFNIASIIVHIIFGINGNKWRENNLPTKGFEFKETVTAANSDGAIALYMSEHQ